MFSVWVLEVDTKQLLEALYFNMLCLEISSPRRPAAATDWCTCVVGANIFSNVSGVTYNVTKQSFENFCIKNIILIIIVKKTKWNL